jgi:DNA-binding CsgD family transcriptional regulator
MLGAGRRPVEIADRVGVAAGKGQPGAFGETGRHHAQCREVGGAAFGHLRVVDRGELRVDLPGGVRGLDQLGSQGPVAGLAHGLALAVGVTGFAGLRPGEWFGSGPPARTTTYDLDEYVYDALTAGASGFLLKEVPPEDLVRSVEVAAAGEALLAPSVTRRLVEEFVRQRPPGASAGRRLDVLTDRETDVLRLVARGMSNAEIAGTLFLGESTAKTHIGHILDKLQLRDRVQAVIVAYEAGLVRSGQLEGT